MCIGRSCIGGEGAHVLNGGRQAGGGGYICYIVFSLLIVVIMAPFAVVNVV